MKFLIKPPIVKKNVLVTFFFQFLVKIVYLLLLYKKNILIFSQSHFFGQEVTVFVLCVLINTVSIGVHIHSMEYF